MMGDHLLNANQRRRISTQLRLLKEDLEDLASWRELARPGDPYDGIRDTVSKLLALVEELRNTLALPAHRQAPLYRRVAATAEVWAISAEDMKANSFRGYGQVNPDLRGVLDGRVDNIVRQLRALASLAKRLPER